MGVDASWCRNRNRRASKASSGRDSGGGCSSGRSSRPIMKFH